MTNSITLGHLVRRIGNYNKMETFDDRLILQKTIYLMQSFDLYVGYDFSWYIRGPYSTQLTKDGFDLRDQFDQIANEGRFKEDDAEMRFQQFMKFIGDKKNDPDWLEITASIHFLKEVYPNMTKQKIIEKVKNKQPYFTDKMCQDAWSYLEQWKLI